MPSRPRSGNAAGTSFSPNSKDFTNRRYRYNGRINEIEKARTESMRILREGGFQNKEAGKVAHLVPRGDGVLQLCCQGRTRLDLESAVLTTAAPPLPPLTAPASTTANVGGWNWRSMAGALAV